MGPLSTGSHTWDVILQLGIALALLTSAVLLYRNYRGR
jgi:low affinity Fe/Cu permease